MQFYTQYGGYSGGGYGNPYDSYSNRNNSGLDLGTICLILIAVFAVAAFLFRKKWPQFRADLKLLFAPVYDPEKREKKILRWLGAFFSIAAIGALYGFTFAYNKIERSKEGCKPPYLYGQSSVIYASMIFFGIFIPIGIPILIFGTGGLIKLISPQFLMENRWIITFFLWLFINFIITSLFLFFFKRWQYSIIAELDEKERHGTARFANQEELEPYKKEKEGFYIGWDYYYKKQGHLLTVAGTRGGKGVNIILPNLLQKSSYSGSWVVVDPKGENAAISARSQREAGRNVIVLNPWNLLGIEGTGYNPLDLLNTDNPDFVDDAQLVAETIVPIAQGGKDSHWDNRARSWVTGLLLHLVTSAGEKEKNLSTLWKWLRLSAEDWQALLIAMRKNSHPIAGATVSATALEILGLMETSEKEYGSVLSNAQRWSDFLKSPALQTSLQESQFSPNALADGNTTLYLIIPADRLKTHYQWLRLVVSTLMRSVIRKPGERVCFLLDEFYALGYLSEIEVALGAYAGFNVSVWAILQNLVQLKDLYGVNWENFISSCAVRHFFNVNDLTTANYVSGMMGQTSILSYGPQGVSGSTGRPLVTPDELRRFSGDRIFTLVDSLFPAVSPKVPYYKMDGLKYDPNPYFKG